MSGLQRDVLSLYRALLKSALAKSSKEVPWRTRMNDHLYNLGERYPSISLCSRYGSLKLCVVSSQYGANFARKP